MNVIKFTIILDKILVLLLGIVSFVPSTLNILRVILILHLLKDIKNYKNVIRSYKVLLGREK